MDDEVNDFDDEENGTSYREPEDIKAHELTDALCGLHLFGDDKVLRIQAWNLTIVDQFIMDHEQGMLVHLYDEEKRPGASLMFASAQSQMWLFAAYEMLRTWRQRAKDVVKWCETGGLVLKIASLKKDLGYVHHNRRAQAEQLEKFLADPSLAGRVQEDLLRTHIPFTRLEFLRIALAKHEVSGKKNSVAYSPGYGRIDRYCGSLNYELETGLVILGTISRRDVADELRALSDRTYLPSAEDIQSFNEFMNGPKGNPFEAS